MEIGHDKIDPSLLTLMLLAGCYSRESLEKAEPIMVYDVNSDPETLARCIPRQFSPIVSQAIAVTVEKSGFNLTMVTGGGMSAYVFHWQIRLLPVAGGHTRAEIRSANSIRGPLAGEEVINAIQACGNAKLTLDDVIIKAMSLSLLKRARQASLVKQAMLHS